MPDEVREAALELASAGLRVLPVSERKTPLLEHGFHDASAVVEDVRAWWTRWPDAGLAIAVPEGVIVVDVDPRNGGDETMREACAAGGVWTPPRTLKVSTQSGGRHYYYRVPGDFDARSRLGRGVDLKRAGKGYAIVPPTAGYSVAGAQPEAQEGWRFAQCLEDLAAEGPDAPGWLLEAMARPPHEDRPAGVESDPRYGEDEYATAYGMAGMAAELLAVQQAEPGGRNDQLNRSAFSLGQLVGGGELDYDHARMALEHVADEIGLEPDEYSDVIERALEDGSAEPRNAPERPEPRGDAPATVLPQAAPSAAQRRPQRAETASSPAAHGRWLDLRGPIPARAPFILDPIIPRASYITAYGPAAASKSMVFAAIAARGSRRPDPVRTDLYSLENGRAVETRRLIRLDADPDYLRATVDGLDLGDPEQAQQVLDDALEAGTDLIIFDTYSHAFQSGWNEDGNARAIEFARVCRAIIRESGVTIVVLDHTGFSSTGEPRDASAKRQQVDVAILMDRPHTEWAPNQPAYFTMVSTKSSRFENPFEYSGKIVDVEYDDEEERGLELRWDPSALDELRWEDGGEW